MQVIETPFEGLVQIIPTVYEDNRGWFYEFFKKDALQKAGILYDFPQENMSFSRKGVVRGLHLQRAPYAQAKLVCVIQGRVLDVVVDLREGSKTFGKVFSCELDSIKRNMLMVPEGFAHGFSALEESIFFYKCSTVYNKAAETGIIWNDPELNINWQVTDPLVSEKDRLLPTFKEVTKSAVVSPG